MATRVVRVRVRGLMWGGDSRRSMGQLLLTLIPIAALLLLSLAPAFTRAGGLGTEPPSAAVTTAVSAQAQLSQGATAMTAAIAKGFTFTVISRSTFHAKKGGPKIQVPDPSDPYTIVGIADSYYVGASAARGTARGADFFLQMYGGETTETGPVDIGALEPTLGALVSGGKAWRNDGEGWYATTTDLLPGIGLDPRTVALLPTLLGRASGPAVTAPTLLEGRSLPTIAATGAVADAPGLMAVDAAPFTVFAEPLLFVFDDQGRVAQLTAVMRNTLMTDFDLLVTAVITFDYSAATEIPAPDPTAPLPPTPVADPAPASSSASEATR